MLFKKALINFAMIQTVIAATSISVGVHIPASNGALMAIGFVYVLVGAMSFLPSVIVSFLFAYFQK